MTFANFELSEPFGSITIRGLGHAWDLHNFADLVAVRQPNHDGVASLEWQVLPDIDNPWGSPGNTANGCRLVFSGVREFKVSAGSPSKSQDSRTVASISKAIPGETEHPFKRDWKPDDPFYLKVETEDEGSIDIDADLATLEAISGLDV